MYNPKDIQFAGKFDYDKDEALKYAAWKGKSFSVNIFKWVLKADGKSMKKDKGVVRVSGSPNIASKVLQVCENTVILLDKGEWDGRKNVSIK